MISERLIDVHQDYTGEYIRVTGQFRSYNHHDEQKNRLVLSVFVREVTFVEEELDGAKTNSIFLDGYICKTPVSYTHLDVYKRQELEEWHCRHYHCHYYRCCLLHSYFHQYCYCRMVIFPESSFFLMAPFNKRSR